MFFKEKQQSYKVLQYYKELTSKNFKFFQVQKKCNSKRSFQKRETKYIFKSLHHWETLISFIIKRAMNTENLTRLKPGSSKLMTEL